MTNLSDVNERVFGPAPTAHRMLPQTRVSWGAIIAGAAVSLVSQMILTLAGVAIGAAALGQGGPDAAGAGAVSTSGAAWYLLAGVLSALVGGLIAASLSGRTSRATGALHGLAAWSVTTLLITYLLTTSVGALVGGALSGVTSVVKTAGSAVATPALLPANPLDAIEQQVRRVSGDQNPEALRSEAMSAIKDLITGDPMEKDAARQRAAEALAKVRGTSVEDAKAEIARYEATYREKVEAAKTQAAEAGRKTAQIVASGALVGCGALILSAIAAGLGGAVGARRYPSGE